MRSPFLLPLLLAACAGYPPLGDLAAEINRTSGHGRVRLLPGDVVSVAFGPEDPSNHEVTVRPDGRTTFLFLGEVEVEGLSVGDLHEMLRKRYGEILDNAPSDLSVDVVEFAERRVYVLGEVTEPGEVVLGAGRLSMIEAIGRVGGPLKKTALLEETLLVRWAPESGGRLSWWMDAGVERWGGGDPVYLRPGDVVFVPNTAIDDVNIWVEQYIRNMLPINIGIPVVN